MSDKSSEQLLNISTVQSPGAPTTNRVVSLAATDSTSITPTSDCIEMHIYNDTGEILRYGGSGVDGSSGGRMVPTSTMVIKTPRPGFAIYFYNPDGSAKDLDIVEFFKEY